MTLDKPPLCVLFLRIRSKDMKVFLQSGFEGPLQGVVKKKKGELCFFLTCLSGALHPPGACMSFMYKDTNRPGGYDWPRGRQQIGGQTWEQTVGLDSGAQARPCLSVMSDP